MTKKDVAVLMLSIFGVLTILGLMAYDIDTAKQKWKQTQSESQQLDQNIQSAFDTIDSLQKTRAQRITDSVNKNPEYIYITNNQARIDSLKHANMQLLSWAYNSARNYSIMNAVYKNESVFSDYAQIPAVKNAGIQYRRNKKEIQNFNQQISDVAAMEQSIRRHIDSVTMAQIFNQQKLLDSLLKQKYMIMHQK